MKRALSLAPLIAVALVLVDAAPAKACSQALNDPATFATFVFPEDRTYDVPVNARIWVGGAHTFFDTEAGTLLDTPREVVLEETESGAVVAGTQTTLRSASNGGSGASMSVLTPSTALTPDVEYAVKVDDEVLGTFITGSDEDNEAPAVPDPRVTGTGPWDPDSTGFECTYPAWSGWDELGDGLIKVVMVDNDSRGLSFDEATIDGTVTVATPLSAARVEVWEDVDTMVLRFGAFDVAGNFSGFSEASTATLPACACASVPRATPWTLALLLVGGAFLRRRRE